MKPFLYQVASLFYSEYGAEVSRLAFVFPNRRTGLFFQKYLSEVSEKPLFSPTILTINDLFVQLSGKQAADRISMLFKLYDIYLRHSGSSETFDEFLYWGEMLLNDFDDIDKYMADARMLFTNVTDLREIENDFSFLSPEQIAAIRTFWSSFYPKGDTPNQEQFLAVWQILYALYTDLREALATEGKGYEGMIFREVVEQMEKDECCDLPYTKVVFVGLNALSVAEERFLSGLQKRGIADFYWDYASPKVTDPDNKASYFVERNLRQFPSQLIENGQLTIDNEDDDKKKIEVIGIPSGIGQAKQVCSILNELCKEDEMSAEEALRTAVILPDEHLLIPVLNAIPEQIKRINVTMGYPLAGTPVASLMEYILALQKNIRYVDRRPVFYFRDVLPILNHRYISTTSPEVVSNLVKDISENNKIYISYDDLNKTPLLSILFTPVTAVETFSDYLINVLQELNKAVEGGKLKVESENANNNKILHDVINQNVTEAVSIYRNHEILAREKDLIHTKRTKNTYIIVFATIAILITIIVTQRSRSQKKEIENNMLLASNLRNMLQIKESEAQEMQDVINSTMEHHKAENEAMQNAISNLFEQRFATIDRLSSTYYEYQGTVNEKHKIYTNVMELVSGLGSDQKTLKELESFVNTYRDNLMSRFRETFPEIKESDCILYLYSVAGFSARAISIFINEKLEVVYNRKSRLKQKISRSSSIEKEKFMSYM